MRTTDRCLLRFGPYRTPVFRNGDVVICERRGQVEIVGLSSGRIRWLIGERNGQKALVLCGALGDAVRRESAIAVAYGWGVSVWSVWQWRKALGVGATNDGTSALRGRILIDEQGVRTRSLARAKDRDPVRRGQIAAARRGNPRPAHVVEAVRQAHLGTTASVETRQRQSSAHRRRGTRPPKAGHPWAADEDAIVRALPAVAAVKKMPGRSLQAVYDRRHELHLPDGRRRK